MGREGRETGERHSKVMEGKGDRKETPHGKGRNGKETVRKRHMGREGDGGDGVREGKEMGLGEYATWERKGNRVRHHKGRKGDRGETLRGKGSRLGGTPQGM